MPTTGQDQLFSCTLQRCIALQSARQVQHGPAQVLCMTNGRAGMIFEQVSSGPLQVSRLTYRSACQGCCLSQATKACLDSCSSSQSSASRCVSGNSMGNVCSCGNPQTSSATKQQDERAYTTSVGQSLGGRDVKNQTKKIGLAGTHQAVKLLGRGAAADIWLFRDLKHGNQVAVKLFERPLPQAALQAVLREIKVRFHWSEHFLTGQENLCSMQLTMLRVSTDSVPCRYKLRLVKGMPT